LFRLIRLIEQDISLLVLPITKLYLLSFTCCCNQCSLSPQQERSHRVNRCSQFIHSRSTLQGTAALPDSAGIKGPCVLPKCPLLYVKELYWLQVVVYMANSLATPPPNLRPWQTCSYILVKPAASIFRAVEGIL
jgi:hypothetical protein